MIKLDEHYGIVERTIVHFKCFNGETNRLDQFFGGVHKTYTRLFLTDYKPQEILRYRCNKCDETLPEDIKNKAKFILDVDNYDEETDY